MRRRKIVTTLAVFLSALAVLAFLLRDKQPAVDGRSLFSLLAEYEVAFASGQADQEKKSEALVRTIGTNAVPWLLAALRTETPPWKVALLQRWNPIVARVNPKWRVTDDAETSKRTRALCGFMILGTNGAIAIPELARMLSGSNAIAIYYSARSLAYVGEPGWPVLFAVFTNRDAHIWQAASFAISGLGTNAAPALPIIIRNLSDTDHTIRMRAASLLGNLRIESETAVPALIQCLRDPDATVRLCVINALAKYGPDARSAIPELVRWLDDPIPTNRSPAEYALKCIDPERFGKPFE